MKKIVTGIVIGMVLSFSASALAGPIKQYLLTEVNYPVVVNGKEYKDANSPILSYQGSTYIPLAKIGELTGVQYKWNDEKKRVEIGSSEVTGGALTGATILPSTEYEVVEAPNPYGYKKLMDADDAQLVIAKVENTSLPPKLSEGWINEDLLRKASGDYSASYKRDDKSTLIIGNPSATDPKLRDIWTFKLPAEFVKVDNGSAEVGGVKLRKYKGFIYFNIEDLENIGVLSK